MSDLVKKYREDLHKIPEPGYREEKTKAYLLNVLKQYDCVVETPCSTAVTAYFKGRGSGDSGSLYSGKTVAIRCDMDALLITEATGLPFTSCHEGLMHACGHDGHMAMVLALAGEIHENLQRLSCNILLLFQPAEEGGGGAKQLCETGILENYGVSRIFGYHLWPGVEKHTIASGAGPVMAKTTEMDIIIKGKSSHCANAEKGIDSLYIGSQFLCDIYRMEKEEVPEQEYRLLKFGKATSGTIRNIISDHTQFYGTMRCFNMEIFDFMLQRIRQIAKRYEKVYGCCITINYNDGYPPVVNDETVYKEIRKRFNGKINFKTIEKPFLQAEDFSFYLEKIPGALMFLGIGDTAPLHSNQFDFDEDVLITGLEAYKILLELN